MDFQFKLNTPSATVSVDSQSLLEMSEQIRNQYQELLALESRMEELRGVVNDIEFVASAVEQYGDKAIPILNSNSRVSKLIGSAEGQVEQLTAKLSSERTAATEGFLDNVKALGRKLVEFIKNLITRIRQFLAVARGDEKALVDSITDAQIASCIQKKVSANRYDTSDGVYQSQGCILGVFYSSRVFDNLQEDSTRTELFAAFKSIEPHIGKVSDCVSKLKNISPKNSQGLSTEDTAALEDLCKNLSEAHKQFNKDFAKETNRFAISHASDLTTIYGAVQDCMKTAEDLLTKIEPISAEVDALFEKFELEDPEGERMKTSVVPNLMCCFDFCSKSSGLLAAMYNTSYNTQRGCVKLARYIAKNA